MDPGFKTTLVVLAVSLSLLITLTEASSECVQGDLKIKEGEFSSPHPCRTCTCNSGLITCNANVGNTYMDGCTRCMCTPLGQACLRVQCPPVACVDPVISDCCPVCPNGPNCRRDDGRVLPAGQIVSDGDLHCWCRGTAAECRLYIEEAGYQQRIG